MKKSPHSALQLIKCPTEPGVYDFPQIYDRLFQVTHRLREVLGHPKFRLSDDQLASLDDLLIDHIQECADPEAYITSLEALVDKAELEHPDVDDSYPYQLRN